MLEYFCIRLCVSMCPFLYEVVSVLAYILFGDVCV